ncbi:MAG: TonB-dependent receptor [Alphaproteobacteria bacterium]|nr:MAG: TonB-dependent receptor [Alphaproteobacteria bacterium]
MKTSSQIRAGLIAGVSLLGMAAAPAFAQASSAAAPVDSGIEEIVVTAQRTAQSLQDVPIAITAFSSEALQRQQIQNSSDLQLTLPNITFTKGNFTGSSFTIRGIGDLCVGVTCDSATAIHINGSPLIATRLFESEFFDLERVEVLRGPQGTLFGRNATSGVINFVTAKPNLSAIGAAGEVDYGNYESLRVRGMFNLPITENLGVRLAGFYLKRDGFTENLFNGEQIDGRDMYGIRGSVRWEPTENTRIDLMGYYFKEDDDRSRIQKQLCQRDPTGVLGCLPGRLDYGKLNGNSTFVGVLSSRELLRIQGGAGFGGPLSTAGLGSLYGPDPYATFQEPRNVRQVNTAFTPEYAAEEQQYQARIEHDFGAVKAQVTGLYQKTSVDSRVDYNLGIQDPSVFIPGLTGLQGLASAPGIGAYFNRIQPAIFPNGVNGPYCTSNTDLTGNGAYDGSKICSSVPLNFDRSNEERRTWSVEGIISTQFDGPFNFLLGGIYLDSKLPENSYFVNGFGIDYVTGVLGGATGLGGGLPPGYLGTPFFRNNTDETTLKSYGIFGELYWNITDTIKVTAGLRYNNDKKTVRARSTLASFYVPFGVADPFASPFAAGFDADPGSVCVGAGAAVPGAIGSRPGCEAFQERTVSFGEFTGRFVVDWNITEDNLIYASYSRGYKSGGINPPLQPIFAVPESFAPEFIDSFEIGTKNTFLDGTLRANVTAFYYKYSALQLSRIVARTSVNDNVDAEVYGVEGEFIIQPTRELALNFGASYLHTKVSQDKFLSNPRDPSGGRSDAVIIKDITNGSNCALVPRVAGNAAGANGYVAAVNSALGLRAPTAFPADSGISGATGAFGICSALAGNAAAAGMEVLFAGVEVNIKGNQLPQAPDFKFSAGAQYTVEFNNGMSMVPRVDLAVTGTSSGNIFNGYVNRIPSYSVINAQVQVNGKDDRWYARAYVQNLTNNSATTGLYVTDQSSGLFTNIFTLEPRRYGGAIGFRF